jgi:hypothetical protein
MATPAVRPYAAALARQMLAALEMMTNAIDACPDDVWQMRMWPVNDGPANLSACWYIAYHTQFWLDLYLEGTATDFMPPEPFTLDEFKPEGVLPAEPLTKDAIRSYIAHNRAKISARVAGLDDDASAAISGFSWLPCSYFEVQTYNLRHVQEHAAQISMFVGQQISKDLRWVKFGALA